MTEPPRGDPLDELLGAYERRIQEETRQQVQKVEGLERDRRLGADVLRRHAVDVVRDACARMEAAGHRVILQELLRDYPPAIRVHVWPRMGPLDEGEPRRATLELVWGQPHAASVCARRWGSGGLGAMEEQASTPGDQTEPLWVREQILEFLRRILGRPL